MMIKLKIKKSNFIQDTWESWNQKDLKHLSECYPLDNRGLESTEVQVIFAGERLLPSQDKYFSKAANHWSCFI